MKDPKNTLVPLNPSQKIKMLENFLHSCRLDGYEAQSSLVKKQLKDIAESKSADDELRVKLIGAYGGKA